MTWLQVGSLAAASEPQGTEYAVLPHAQDTLAVSGQGRHAPAWHGEGSVWLPQRSLLPHTCCATMS